MLRLLVPVLALLTALGLAAPAAGEPYRPVVMYEDPEAGDDHHAGHDPYPDLAAATPEQRRNARQVMRDLRSISGERFPTLDAAIALGYERGARVRFIGQQHGASGAVHSPFVRYDMRAYDRDGRTFDLRRPESLVYWRNPAGDPLLVGIGFRAPSTEPPPDVHGIGKIPLWHARAICDEDPDPDDPRQFPSMPCPSGLAHFGEQQMAHVWLTEDVRTGYAMEVPARSLNIFVEGVPKLYAGDGAASAGHEHAAAATPGGDGHAHEHAATLTLAQLVVANAWAVSVLAPAAGAVLLLFRRRRLDRPGVRLAGIACLGGVAVTHASDLAAHAGEAPYLAVGFCLLIAASAALAVLLGTARRAEPAWALAGGLAGLAAIGFLLSRTIGLPELEDHVGHWDAAGVASLLFESLLVTLSLAVVAAGVARRRVAAHARSGAAPGASVRP